VNKSALEVVLSVSSSFCDAVAQRLNARCVMFSNNSTFTNRRNISVEVLNPDSRIQIRV
jgi:hypothetical protein